MTRCERRLLVIVSEAISDWVHKGEVIDRYYNPGDYFDRLDLVLTNDDNPAPDALRRLAGRAELHVHNVPTPASFLRRTLGYQPRLLRPWADGVLAIAREARPALVRCYGADINAFAATEIRRRLGTPFLVSLHTNHVASRDPRLRALARLGAYALRRADLVLPVYESIVPDLQRISVTRYEVAYNVVNATSLRRKTDYALHRPARLISVGRMFDLKDPREIVRALVELPDVVLTLVGDGPLRDEVEQIAAASGVANRLVVRPRIANDELCALLAEQDLFIAHCQAPGISKAALEALLTGLPVIHNRRSGDPVPEFSDGAVMLTEHRAADYAAAVRDLLDDHERRAAQGRRGATIADDRWAPASAERHVVEIYKRFVEAA